MLYFTGIGILIFGTNVFPVSTRFTDSEKFWRYFFFRGKRSFWGHSKLTFFYLQNEKQCPHTWHKIGEPTHKKVIFCKMNLKLEKLW